MNRTNRNPDQRPVKTVAAGLTDLTRVFHERNIAISSITLKRGTSIFEHPVTSAFTKSESIEASYRSVSISVACRSPIDLKVRHILEARTRFAALDAFDWKEVAVQLTLDQVAQPQLTNMVGASARMEELLADIERAAGSSHVVLILGECGTGKTTAASMIHARSRRAEKPFIDVNCAAIPDSLIESELFGHEKGAFTGAFGRKRGLFEVAAGGTLFLDEVGELKLELQAKLLTAIEQQRIRRVGSTTQIKCDIRILAASSRDLQQMVAEGTFREDLYYRLSVLEIEVPPLRERREDIPVLTKQRLLYEQEQQSGNLLEIGEAAVALLTNYDWPGNIRQLHNVIARLATRAEKDLIITRDAVSKELARFNHHLGNGGGTNDGTILLPATCRTLLPDESFQQFITRVKRALINTVRNQTGGITAASVRLKVNRTALSRLQTRLHSSTAQEAAVTMD